MQNRGLSVSALIFIGSLITFVALLMIFLVVNFENTDEGNEEVPYATITVKE